MAVHEPGEEHAGNLHDLHSPSTPSLAADCTSQLGVRTNPGDASALDQHGRVREHIEVGHLAAPARPRRAPARDDLARADEQTVQSWL